MGLVVEFEMKGVAVSLWDLPCESGIARSNSGESGNIFSWDLGAIVNWPLMALAGDCGVGPRCACMSDPLLTTLSICEMNLLVWKLSSLISAFSPYAN
jgi:hypothetical protein